MNTETKPYTVSRARYRRLHWAIRPQDNRDRYKGPTSHILDALKAGFSGREGAYLLPDSKLAIFQEMVATGWKATLAGRFHPPGDSITDEPISYAEAKKLLKGNQA